MSSVLKWSARLGGGAVVLGLLGWLLYFALQPRGPTELEQVKANLLAQGETLNFPSLLPETVPDEENFCAIPALAGIARAQDGSAEGMRAENLRQQILRLLAQPAAAAARATALSRSSRRGVPADLAPLAGLLRKEGKLTLPESSTDAAHEVVAAYADRAPFFQELTAGLSRPRAQWTPGPRERYSKRPWLTTGVPQIAISLCLTQALTVRGVAAAQTADGQRAMESWAMSARLQQATASESTLIGMLLAQAMQPGLDATVWEMAAARVGSASEWRTLEQRYAQIDVKPWALQDIRGERALGADMLEFCRDHRSDAKSLFLSFAGPGAASTSSATVGDHTADLTIRALPDGLFESNEAAGIRMVSDFIINPLRDGTWGEAIAKAGELEKALAIIQAHPVRNYRQMLASLTIGWQPSVTGKLLYWQASVTLAATACRLESYRLEHGAYPEALTGLTLSEGSPLPADPVNGRPLGYRRTENGRYALWSIGRDGVDDGGMRGNVDVVASETYRGDWVWDFQGIPAQSP